MPASTEFPIWKIHADILRTLHGNGNRLVLVAPAGSGKTTQMLLDAGVAGEKMIVALQDDRALQKVGAVVFDDFHERNLLSDVTLALVKHLQQSQRLEDAGDVCRTECGASGGVFKHIPHSHFRRAELSFGGGLPAAAGSAPFHRAGGGDS
ncbi:hypothetical protein [Prosthecobacter vanneervenii]|uniref:Uncharacterized protein n=1 Tax=Prosthecobacter vanneervenii TaxID=48466 RepID=A0A7W7Y8G9_9BACT|nr:hypothetical protein [Prosthecobacter vanneervenii]MBB5031514.1 hypothetical protein [Prosthecobacter vanneervenii]